MKDEDFEFDIMEELNTVASVTECTGLMQIPPISEEEAEAYGEIYVVPEQVNDFAKVKKLKGKNVKSAP